jgi:hypothetical protein
MAAAGVGQDPRLVLSHPERNADATQSSVTCSGSAVASTIMALMPPLRTAAHHCRVGQGF